MAWTDYFKTVVEQLAMLVSGTTEAGSAIPGPPVQIKVGSVAPQLDDTDKIAVSCYGKGTAEGDTALALESAASPNLRVRIYSGSNGITASAGADGNADTQVTLGVGARGYRYNGSGWDRERGNYEATILASAARTATVSSADMTNHNGRGVMLVVDVTAAVDTPSVVLTLEGKVGSKYTVLLTAAAVTGISTAFHLLYPGAAAAAGGIATSVGFALPRTWRVTMTHADADSITYSVSACLIL